MDPVAILGFTTCLILWGTFAVLLIQNRRALDSIWRSFRRQPIGLQGVEGVVLLPWAVGLAIWERRWAVWLRLFLMSPWPGPTSTPSSRGRRSWVDRRCLP